LIPEHDTESGETFKWLAFNQTKHGDVDPWWNPFVEQQAIDRIYRIGQKKNIHVYKLYMSFTIEEWMNNLKMIKLEKSNIAIGKCDFTMGISGSLGQKEIDGLFQYVNTYVGELSRRINK
jgi:hypothetical protein